ncbi:MULTISPECIES: universal stress protein [Methanosarcina]|uniref:Universal stress protein n=3 Tax=Methanosarcina barkeri TaxID=2208 RepID=A0A0E3QW82_METBA|nr:MULTISPECIES: universal stress protein [Methanosarcina]AKB54918.1 Universal stress protein [Methanosarcina barkeri MS]AKB57006.1 Universal stress protein [Methanosarcina barkeri 227]AKJ37573.1 universal stress protein UspA4 [Methanosarcina barkeri CM1]OED10108.1 universal stress protein [Methanosarcina sp. A14]
MRNTVFRNIMVATDGSERVRKAIFTAVEVAKLSEAKLYAVHVIELGGYDSLIQSRSKEWNEAIKDQLIAEGKDATSYVENVGRAANVKVESVILEGNPAEEIVDFAEENDIGLIVIGTQGRTGVHRFLIGSVAENVIRQSNVRVLVVRGEAIEKGK